MNKNFDELKNEVNEALQASEKSLRLAQDCLKNANALKQQIDSAYGSVMEQKKAIGELKNEVDDLTVKVDRWGNKKSKK